MYFTVCTEHVVDINKGARRVLESIEMEVGVNNSTELFFKRHLCTKPVYEVCIVLYNTCMGFPLHTRYYGRSGGNRANGFFTELHVSHAQ